MTDEVSPMFDPDHPLAVAAFSGPAVLSDRFLITEQDGMVRISVAEGAPDGTIHFRGAVVISLAAAQEMADILGRMVRGARERDGR